MIEEEDEEPEDYEDRDEDEDSTEDEGEEDRDAPLSVEDGRGNRSIVEDNTHTDEGDEDQTNPYTFVVPIAQGWIGDYASSSTMVQPWREWSPGIFGWPTPEQ